MKLRNRIRELRYVKASELLPNPRNWRTHPQEQQDALRGVLAEVGIADALLVRETPAGLQLVDGHCRADLGADVEWPCLVLDVDEVEAAKLLATVDPLAAMAETDAAKLEQLLAEVDVQSDGLQVLLNRLSDEAAEANGGADPDPDPGDLDDPEPEVNRADELQSKWKTERGQLWILEGKQSHRLMCGDSTCREDVERLMGGELAGLMNTDPPYGVAYANDERPNPGVAKPRVANDEMQDEKLQEFLHNCFTLAAELSLTESAAWYLWHAHLTQGYFAAAAAAAANVVLHRQIIWVKPVLLLGRGQYHWKHEPCFMGWVKGHQPPDYGEGNGERTQTTVWEVASVNHADRREFNHSTPKPLGLFTVPIVKHLRPREVAYEPFAGTGPQIIAAEQLNRRCFAMELAPQYVAVILERATKVGITPRLDS